MPDDAPLTAEDQELLGKMARLVERRGINGVYLMRTYSKSVGAPVLILGAIGEQAMAIEQILTRHTVQQGLIVTPGTAAHKFATGGENGNSRE